MTTEMRNLASPRITEAIRRLGHKLKGTDLLVTIVYHEASRLVMRGLSRDQIRFHMAELVRRPSFHPLHEVERRQLIDEFVETTVQIRDYLAD